MQNFESKSLGRTFDTVYFVTALTLLGAPPEWESPSLSGAPIRVPAYRIGGGTRFLWPPGGKRGWGAQSAVTTTT